MPQHYHAPVDEHEETVYLDKKDADDALADTIKRSLRAELVNLRHSRVKDRKVRACENPLCVYADENVPPAERRLIPKQEPPRLATAKATRDFGGLTPRWLDSGETDYPQREVQDFVFRALLDESRLRRDPSLPAPAEGQEDTRPLVPDPEWVVERTWGADPPDGTTRADYWAWCQERFKDYVLHEMRRRGLIAPPRPRQARRLLRIKGGEPL